MIELYNYKIKEIYSIVDLYLQHIYFGIDKKNKIFIIFYLKSYQMNGKLQIEILNSNLKYLRTEEIDSINRVSKLYNLNIKKIEEKYILRKIKCLELLEYKIIT